MSNEEGIGDVDDRTRVAELEEEVETWKKKYDEEHRHAMDVSKQASAATAEKETEENRRRLADEEQSQALARAYRAEQQLAEANAKLKERGKFDELVEKELAAPIGLQDFVSDSLSDIMKGVDHAALFAVERYVSSGLREDPMISPSRIGQVAQGSETLVHFDLAVTANAEEVENRKKITEDEMSASASASIMQVLSLSAAISHEVRQESGTAQQSGISQQHRIRFSVPIVFAEQDDLTG